MALMAAGQQTRRERRRREGLQEKDGEGGRKGEEGKGVGDARASGVRGEVRMSWRKDKARKQSEARQKRIGGRLVSQARTFYLVDKGGYCQRLQAWLVT